MTARNEIIHGISATRASAILGLNQWKTPVLAWQEIMEKLFPPQYNKKGAMTYRGFNAERGYILPEREDKAVFRWGNAFESSVVELAAQAQGDKIKDLEKLACDEGAPPAFCYLDGVYQKQDRGLILHEGKSTFERAYRKSWGEPGTDRVPDHIAVQAQHQMMCAGADECIVSVLVLPKIVDDWEDEGWTIKASVSGDKFYLVHEEKGLHLNPYDWAKPLAQQGYFHQYPVQSKPDTHKMLREMYDHFWQNYVLTEKEPECEDYADVKRLFPAPKGVLVVDDEVAGWFKEYKDCSDQIKAKSPNGVRKEQLKVRIVKFLKDKTTVADDDAIEKIVCKDQSGNDCGSFNGQTFRAR